MDAVQSSADNTENEDSFEDAADTNEPTSKSPQHETKTETKVETGGSESVPPSKSPLLTAHRMSRDDVEAPTETEKTEKTEENSVRTVKSMAASIEQTDTSSKDPVKSLPRPSRFTGFSASLPGVPWAAPPKRSVDARDPSPSNATRKATNPFAWLGRAASGPKGQLSPPLAASNTRNYVDARRNTAGSISTVGSNPDLMLKALDDGPDAGAGAGSKPPARTSLREKFKALRMREEAGITSLDDPEKAEGGAIAGLIGRTTSLSMGVGSPESMKDEDQEGVLRSPSVTSPTSPHVTSPIINPSLAPGTAQGALAGPGDATTPIDWDFWQTVVNEGPQAVARTSPEELASAIASGIPTTIRGVIWQVLANSKNEDLESVYQDLKLRGTGQEVKESSNAIAVPNGHANGSLKESLASSSSSVHSDHSTPATSANVGVTSSSSSHDALPSDARLDTRLAAERQKKVRDDAVALSKLEKAIKRDMGTRTSFSKYTVAAGFQDGLFNVCKAYALFDEAVGYPQGMNFIIMPLLFTMPEEEAFCLLVRLMNKYRLRELFIQDMPGLHLHLYQFERLLEDLEPALYCHLNRRGVTPKLYATQWFLTMFAYRFPLQLVLRVYDLVLSEGLEGAILKFGMAVIQRNVATLLAMNDMLTLTNFLKEKVFDVYIDQTPSSKSLLESGFFGNSGGSDTEVYRADLLVQDACAIKLTPELLNRYREEWEEKAKVDKDRETELDNYKTTITSQASKIRSLEERAGLSDTEHVQIASDLVRIKVENQELEDANESLRGQVEELKKVAESEAATVESRLKAEMDRVMQRNMEVQNENRHMEDQMAEMEKDLVETKMKYAELNGEHENLRQKWSDLRKALD